MSYKNYKSTKNNIKKKKILRDLKNLNSTSNQIFASLKKNYKDSYDKKLLSKIKKYDNFKLIGMGGSILGAKAIYNFLQPKHKKFQFIDNFSEFNFKKDKKKKITIIVSKSGNTLETISNISIHLKKKEKNIFLTENKKNYLTLLAKKLKADIISHNNYIGGRYSVLSEVGMLPAHLMGFKPEKFRRLNHLINNKQFINSLTQSVLNILLLSKKKTNSIILNYDHKSNEFFNWYQQLVAESLGKKSKGILPVVSTMPQDNHSLMQYYLDGTKNNFFTLYFFKEKKSKKINKNLVLKSHDYLKNKDLNDILFSQFSATEKVFNKKGIPFRSFIVQNRNEETLGELFTFFILETILLGFAIGVNPYDQPAVELIKKDTTKILKST
ncbi:glucose-6-phosphate isomerase [Pelagibacterales bacterium SAG-MED43]|nr:glucose-6-phosphate isomerase [Pelagibacterales bacterium SAG-MED43]